MRKLLNLVVLFAFTINQTIWATHLDWKPEFESASVLPYHIDGKGRHWVLLSKKTYNDPDYGAPSWGDFGGKIEDKDGGRSVATAVRELSEETSDQITASEDELLAGPCHQIDMKNSPYGDECVRRHTLFFKRMVQMILPAVEAGIDQGPTSGGGREVSQYQWVLVKDLLEMQVPAIFGRVLGLYTPEALRVESLRAEQKKEYFSAPFFVLLQQTDVRNTLLRDVNHKTFSQIVFTGFQDWRSVHHGLLSPPTSALDAAYRDRQLQQVLEFDPEAEIFTSTPTVQIRLFHRPGAAPNVYPFAADSPNSWRINFPEKFNDEKDEKVKGKADYAEQLIKTYVNRSVMLQQLKTERLPTLKARAEPTAAPEPFPFGTLPTMTDAQLRHLFKDGEPVDLADTAAVLSAYKDKVKSMRPHTTQVDTITHASFVQAVSSVLAEERAHPGMFTAYHGCAAPIHFLNTLYGVLADKLGLAKRAVNWRLFDSASRHYPNVTAAFTDTAQSGIQESSFVNPFEVLVAANPSLTGNPEHDGCRTLTYWKVGHSEIRFDLRHMLGDVLTGLGVDSGQANILANRLFDLYQDFYYVDDPEPPVAIIPGAVPATAPPAPTIAATKRAVGILRQVFVAPESVEAQLALSGWFFDTPLTFDDRRLPDDRVISIYQGLEDGDNAYMARLSNTLRFMSHIRAGHSDAMGKNIRVYHEQAPNGLRPFSLDDYEARLFAGQDPALVRTHYYPQSAADPTREEIVGRASCGLIGASLEGTELPVRSFHDFYRAYKQLQQIFKNQLGIRIAAAPVSLLQFKAAVAQGDREAMGAYLDDPSNFKCFEEVDIVSKQTRTFTLADYMAMVAMRHRMALNVIEAVSRKYSIPLQTGVHFTDTPFALSSLLKDGLNGLQQLAWSGDLSTRFRFAQVERTCDFGPDAIAKEETFSGVYHEFTVASAMQPPQTPETDRALSNIGYQTDYAKLPPTFWKNLVATGNVDLFLRSSLLHYINAARWDAIVVGFNSAGVDEDRLHTEHRNAILEMFREKKMIVASISYTHNTFISKDSLTRILRKLVGSHGKQAIIDHLKTFGTDINIDMENDAEGPTVPTALYYIFRDVGLIDHTWHEFFRSMTKLLCTSAIEAEKQLDDIIEILRDGYTGIDIPNVKYGSYRLGNSLGLLPFEKILHYLREPVLADLILKMGEDPIEKNDKLSPQEKKALHRELYSLALQKGTLKKIPTIPTELTEWFAVLPTVDRLGVFRQSLSPYQMESLNLPILYSDDASIDMVRREVFPTAMQVIEFVSMNHFVMNKFTMEWFSKLMWPHLPETLEAALQDSDKITPFAAVLFNTAGMQMPDGLFTKVLRG